LNETTVVDFVLQQFVLLHLSVSYEVDDEQCVSGAHTFISVTGNLVTAL